MKKAYEIILLSILILCSLDVSAQNVLIGTSLDTVYTELKGQDNKKVLLWDNGNAQLRNHYNLLSTKRDWMRFYIDSNNDQNNAEFGLYKDTSGVVGYDLLPTVRFHLDNGDSWINGTGKFGLGTDAPSKKLDVAGDINLSGDLYKNNVLYKPDNLSLNDLTDAQTGFNSLYLGNGGSPSGINNTAVGNQAMPNNTGSQNTAVGRAAMSNNSTGQKNTAVGTQAMLSNSTGETNTTVGNRALLLNNIGDGNVAMGFESMLLNTSGDANVAIGIHALRTNSNRSNLVAVGDSALYTNGSSATQSYHATENTAIGSKALFSNTKGYSNTAAGSTALKSNQSGYENSAFGAAALNENESGHNNSAMGNLALTNNTGNFNTAMGSIAANDNTAGNSNVAIGYRANENNAIGSNNTIIGTDAGRGNTNHNKSGNVFLGYQAGYNELTSNKLYIENSSSNTPLIWGDFSNNKVKINGDFEISDQLKIPTGAIDGYVLTSDASGNASWEEAAGGGGGADDDWIINGDDIYHIVGNVGIGSGAPNSKLSVGGNGNSNAVVSGENYVPNGYGIYGQTGASGYSVGVYGTTTGSAGASTSAVGVYGSATSGTAVRGHISNSTGIAILGTRGGSVGKAGRFEGPVDITEKLSIGANPTGMAYMLAVDGTAAKSSGGTTWAVASDQRLKDIHGSYQKGLKDINQLNTIVFSYKKDNPLLLPSDQKEYGFIAQDVQKVYPEAVSTIDGEYLDFNFHPILVSMVNALQEMSTENEKLKAALEDEQENNSNLAADNKDILARLGAIEKKLGLAFKVDSDD